MASRPRHHAHLVGLLTLGMTGLSFFIRELQSSVPSPFHSDSSTNALASTLSFRGRLCHTRHMPYFTEVCQAYGRERRPKTTLRRHHSPEPEVTHAKQESKYLPVLSLVLLFPALSTFRSIPSIKTPKCFLREQRQQEKGGPDSFANKQESHVEGSGLKMSQTTPSPVLPLPLTSVTVSHLG